MSSRSAKTAWDEIEKRRNHVINEWGIPKKYVTGTEYLLHDPHGCVERSASFGMPFHYALFRPEEEIYPPLHQASLSCRNSRALGIELEIL